MNGGIVPSLLLSAALGFMLGFINTRVAWISVASFATAALLASFITLPVSSNAIVFGLLISTLLTAATVYLPGGPVQWLALAFAINDGIWLGLHASVSLQRSELLYALPLGLLFIPAKWINDLGYSIAIKVMCSWLIAIAALAIFVSLVPTPGYMPDHME